MFYKLNTLHNLNYYALLYLIEIKLSVRSKSSQFKRKQKYISELNTLNNIHYFQLLSIERKLPVESSTI